MSNIHDEKEYYKARKPEGENLAKESLNHLFTIYWKDGTSSVLTGSTLPEALERNRFEAGDIQKIDIFVLGVDCNYTFNGESWERIIS